MSYPRPIQALIIEDDPGFKEQYTEIFKSLRKRHPVVVPRFAFSYEDAAVELESPHIFQLVILDLCLPRRAKQPAEEGVELGLSLLGAAERRDAYPIPSMLVITGNAGKAQQTALRSRLKRGFSFGELVVKGDHIETEIEGAIEHICEYHAVGIHLKDTGERVWPTISPREEDLLRRAALGLGAIGVDLTWWTAEHMKSNHGSPAFGGWTKTLMGQLLLAEARGSSRINFFKFSAAGDGQVVEQDARLLQQKLDHIKVTHYVASSNRMLLVTEKVGREQRSPISLHDYLSRPTNEVAPHVRTIVHDIFLQLEALGGPLHEFRRLPELLWRGHDDERITSARARYGVTGTADLEKLRVDALAALCRIRESDLRVSLTERECVHGDLNATNVAIDIVDGVPQSYIFDASGTHRGAAVEDVAMLEVSTLLHLPSEEKTSMVQACATVLYGGRYAVESSPCASDGLSDRAINTILLVKELRKCVALLGQGQAAVYPLAVFDQALIQLGGLMWRSGNKVSQFSDAVLLADLTAGWYERAGASVLQSEWTGLPGPTPPDGEGMDSRA